MTPPPGLDRRLFLALGVGSAAATGIVGPVWANPRFGSDPFAVGVASGEPRTDAVVIWTRLAPDPGALDGSGGMPDRRVPVSWQVAEDEQLRRVVRSGATVTSAEVGHSVHVDVTGLQPGREYFYRFRVGQDVSPVGRTKTMAAGTGTRDMTFAFASCQSYSNGYFSGYPHMVADDPDVVFFLGDYIYRQPGLVTPGGGHLVERQNAPQHSCETLADFRLRYAHYRTDPQLAEAHRLLPWVVTIDDNEIDNNWFSTDPDPARVARRIVGMQAFWENMPLLPSSRPVGWQLPVAYRRLSYGDLVDFHVITTRHFRQESPSGECAVEDRDGGFCPPALDPDRTILGDQQERWLHDGLRTSTAQWNVLANQVFFTMRDKNKNAKPDKDVNLAAWDGFVADRQAILDLLAAEHIRNFVVITGDSHRNWVANTPPTYRDWDTGAPPIATEFLVTSINSGGERVPNPTYGPAKQSTPHLLYRDNSHGYALATVDRDQLRIDYRAVSTVLSPAATIETISSWTVADDQPGAVAL
ncbi:alkaline phosphatase D family protein [Microlunatus sp. Y2014]|uniref:alkaline phosphatase D family protein n=1 Tax=Microlunatus sp. Y2014 TaxID=3418488 RepID=UPI003DA70BB7